MTAPHIDNGKELIDAMMADIRIPLSNLHERYLHERGIAAAGGQDLTIASVWLHPFSFKLAHGASGRTITISITTKSITAKW